MEFLILSHFQEIHDFRNFASLTDAKLPEFFFFKKPYKLRFAENSTGSGETVYWNRVFDENDFEYGILLKGKEKVFGWHFTLTGPKIPKVPIEMGKRKASGQLGTEMEKNILKAHTGMGNR